MSGVWRVELMEDLRAVGPDRVVEREETLLPYEPFRSAIGLSHSSNATHTASSSVNAWPAAQAAVNASSPRAARAATFPCSISSEMPAYAGPGGFFA